MTKKKETYEIVVTDVRVYPIKTDGFAHIKALASVTINNAIIIRGLRVMDGQESLFVSYPNDPFYKGEDFRSIVNPITREARVAIEDAVLEAYEKETSK